MIMSRVNWCGCAGWNCKGERYTYCFGNSGDMIGILECFLAGYYRIKGI